MLPRLALAATAMGLAISPSLVHAQYVAGKGSLGGSLGVPVIMATSELKEGQHLRLMAKGHFQYVISPDWRLSLRGGFGWWTYSSKAKAPFVLQADSPEGDSTRVDQFTLLNPFTAAVVFTHRFDESWQTFVGGGPGMYRINIENDHRTIFDPVTHERFRTWSPGVTGELGMEYFIPANRNVSLEGVGTIHYLLKTHEDKFPSGYSGHHAFLDLSLGEIGRASCRERV